MYTNIDLAHLCCIVSDEFEYLRIEEKFGINKHDLIEIIKILIKSFSYISYGEEDSVRVLKQSKGVPMGGALSYHISEFVTARGIERFTRSIPRSCITCMYKYVDDILIICDADILKSNLLGKCVNDMPYTTEFEMKRIK